MRTPIAILFLALAVPRPSSPPDLDVGVPPGSPTGWASRIPVATPPRRSWQVVTPRSMKGGTVAGMPRRPVDHGIGGAGVLRITTPDVTGHLPWVTGARHDGKAVTGGVLAALPPVGTGLRWVGMAAFLRLLLHRQQVSAAEVVAHLVELGEPAALCAEAAAGDSALEEPAKDVLRRLDSGPRGNAAPVGASPREAMWLRFVAEEVAAAHPFDPAGGFGRRLFLFAEQVEPFLVRWLQTDADRFVVRNAAAALARYRTPGAQAALLAAVATTRDDVVLMRALAGLAPGADPGPLLKRLAGSNDDVEIAALVAALGRIGAGAAVPVLLERVRARGRDEDLLLTTLVALNRIALPGERGAVAEWAGALLTAARAEPTRFRVEGRQLDADVPDQPSLRGETVEQLATCLRVRLGVPGADRQLAGLFGARAPARAGGRAVGGRMRPFWPAAQIPVLEALPRLPDGEQLLAAVAADAAVDPILRITALSLLSPAVRDPIAEELVAGGAGPFELRLAGLEVLEHDGAATLAGHCRRIWRQVHAQAPGQVSTPQRQLAVAALRSQPQVDATEVDELVAWFERLGALPPAADPEQIVRIRKLATDLVDDTAEGLKPAQLTARIEALVDQAIAARIDPRFVPAIRKEILDYVRGLLANVRKQRNDPNYRAMVKREVADYFAPAPSTVPVEAIDLAAAAPLEEELLFAVGRSRTPAAVAALVRLLARADLPLRGQACLAAASTGDRSLLQPLARVLLDDDGFVRLCAGEALQQLTGRVIAVDWLHGSIGDRGAAAQEWFRIATGVGR